MGQDELEPTNLKDKKSMSFLEIQRSVPKQSTRTTHSVFLKENSTRQFHTVTYNVAFGDY